MEDSSTVRCARRELEIIGEEPKIVDWYCKVIAEYHSFGHSGGSHSVALPTLIKLLNQENLSPLTNNPEEWGNVSDLSARPLWQNKRNGEAFSYNGGITYYLISEGAHSGNRKPLHASEEFTDGVAEAKDETE